MDPPRTKTAISTFRDSTPDPRPRHNSLGSFPDRLNGIEPLSVRLSSTYRSAKCLRRVDMPDRVLTIDEEPEDRKNVSTIREIDAGQPPPIDDSLFFDNLQTHRDPKINVATFKNDLWSCVTSNETKMLVRMEREGLSGIRREITDFPKDSQQRFLNVAYVWSCYRGLTKLLPELESAGADHDHSVRTTGMNGILAASLSGKVDCLRYLIERGCNVNYVNRANNYSVLHMSAFGRSRETARLLIDNGATINTENERPEVESVLHTAVRTKCYEVVELLLERGASVFVKNNQGETALHVACFVQSIACTEIILKTPGIDVNAVDRAHRTPLHLAVMTNDSSVELVELLINNGADVNASCKVGFTPLHIAALNEQSQCVDSLIWAGADVSATTGTGLSALNVILRKIPESIRIFRQRLDASIRLKRPVSHNREFEMRFHFDILFPSNNPCETSFINTFVHERRKDLLSHPLVMAFLHLKWERIRKFYLLRIFFYAITVVCMTTYVLTALAYKCYNNEDNGAAKVCSNKKLTGFLFRKTVIEIEWYLSLILTCVTIPRKIFGFMVYKSARQYFSNIDNILDGVVVTSVFVTSFVYTGRTYDWQNYVGAFAILCAWTNLMLMVGQLPAFGTYVAMFTHIQLEFAKLLLAYSGLLIGFTISFCVIFVGEPSFDNPLTGLIKVLAMMAGELDFEGLINQADQVKDGHFVLYHPLSVFSQILFTLFLVFVTVILMNLLVGIAVHDIQGLRNHAGVTKLVRQTKLILFTEMMLHDSAIPQVFRRWMFDRDIDVENRKQVLVVKPLNPLEKRLPKEILKAAYEIAQKRVPLINDEDLVVDRRDDRTRLGTDYDRDFDDAEDGEKFCDGGDMDFEDLRVIRKQLIDNNRILSDLLSRLGRERNV